MFQRQGFSCYLVLYLAAIVPSSAYFQASIGGYVFSIPGFDDRQRRTQVNAQTWCNGNQSKLLEITSGDIQSSIVSFIKMAMDQSLMSGNNVITNGKRFNTPLTWVNGFAYSSSVFVKGQEAEFINSYGYLNKTQSGFDFFVDSPIATRGYICEGSSFCATGFTTNGRCYKSFSEQLPWYDARNRCTDEKGDLASFDFIVDNSGFSALSGSGWNPPSSFWIGLTRLKWTWQISKLDFVFSRWSGGYPIYSNNENIGCLCLLPNTPSFDWNWSECDCTQTYQFVCMTETGSSSRTQTTSLPNTIRSNSIFSTTREAAGRTTQSSGATTLFSSSESVSATGLQYPAPSSCACASNEVLAVGLGVGLGVGIPVAIIILFLALIIVQQRRKIKSLEMNRKSRSGGTPMEVKVGNAATYESLKKDGHRGNASTYEELSVGANRQNSET